MRTLATLERMGTEALSLFGVACAVIIFVIAAIVIVFL
jgi:small-conductance mechanosensitive channel